MFKISSFWQQPAWDCETHFCGWLGGVWHMNNWSIICGALPWIAHHAGGNQPTYGDKTTLPGSQLVGDTMLAPAPTTSKDWISRAFQDIYNRRIKIVMIEWWLIPLAWRLSSAFTFWATDISPPLRIFWATDISAGFPHFQQSGRRQFEVRGEQMAGSLLLSHTPHTSPTYRNRFLLLKVKGDI